MKGSFRCLLATALTMFCGSVFALGLGTIQINSKLDQPLNAEIPVLAASPSELAALKVGLASADDFERVGLDRSRVTLPLEFAVGTNRSGQTVIKVTTKEPVREPFVDFLLDASWPNGKVLREYTVLLDPPLMAPAIKGSSASVSPAQEAPKPVPAQKLEEKSRARPVPARVKPARTVSRRSEAKPKSAPKPKPVAEHKPASAKPRTSAASGEYGPVAKGETLSAIARATKPDSADLNAYMLAMLKANPNAFFKDNINALKRGAILRIPSAEAVHESGSAEAAEAAVRAQNQAWGAGVPVAKPTLVAKAGAPKPKKPGSTSKPAHKPKTASSAAPRGHLALVPPRANKGGKATADHPGSSSGTGAAAANRAELARTKEALDSRIQEVGELKSRVKELEDLRDKNRRLLSMKDSELADLQQKLKKLQAEANKPESEKAGAVMPAAKTPASAPTAAAAAPSAATSAAASSQNNKAPAKITAKDIWGDINAGQTTTTAPKAAPPAAEAKPESTTMPAANSTVATSMAANTTAAMPAQTKTTAPKTTENAPKETKPGAVTTPLNAKAPSKPRPISPAPEPWYMNTNALYGGGAILLLIGLILLMRAMRRPKLQPRPATSTAGLDEGFDTSTHDGTAAEEHDLLERLSQNPTDSEASLELLSLYYANGQADKFEAVAEDMYAHIADPRQAEWQQVRAMGEELCPHNPLFGGTEDLAAAAGYAHDDHEHADEHSHLPDTLESEHGAAAATKPATTLSSGLHEPDADPESFIFDDADGMPAHTTHVADQDDGFDFDLSKPDEPKAVPAPAVPQRHDADTLVGGQAVPDLPPLEMDSGPSVPAVKPIDEPSTEDEYVPEPISEASIDSEDAIGTKLDLAKAYLDMGDPEGARSMLDEVMAEGNAAQKEEARKLLAEIH